jgi:hypothetical protein
MKQRIVKTFFSKVQKNISEFSKYSEIFLGLFEINSETRALYKKLQMLRQVQKACGILPQNRPSLFFQQGKTEEAG